MVGKEREKDDDGGAQEIPFEDREGEVFDHKRDLENDLDDLLKEPRPLPDIGPQIVPGKPGDEFLPPLPGHPFEPQELDHDNPDNEGDPFRIINEDGEEVEVNAGEAGGAGVGGAGGIGAQPGEPGVEEKLV
jgi:hypothetical protein